MIQEYSMLDGLDVVRDAIRRDFPCYDTLVEERVRFYEEHFPNLESGLKTCTIRFKQDIIRIPWNPTTKHLLPCFATRPYDSNYLKDMGFVNIPHILVAHLKDFPLWACQMDGYASVDEMADDIGATYDAVLSPEDVLSYYSINQYIKKR